MLLAFFLLSLLQTTTFATEIPWTRRVEWIASQHEASKFGASRQLRLRPQVVFEGGIPIDTQQGGRRDPIINIDRRGMMMDRRRVDTQQGGRRDPNINRRGMVMDRGRERPRPGIDDCQEFLNAGFVLPRCRTEPPGVALPIPTPPVERDNLIQVGVSVAINPADDQSRLRPKALERAVAVVTTRILDFSTPFKVTERWGIWREALMKLPNSSIPTLIYAPKLARIEFVNLTDVADVLWWRYILNYHASRNDERISDKELLQNITIVSTAALNAAIENGLFLTLLDNITSRMILDVAIIGQEGPLDRTPDDRTSDTPVVRIPTYPEQLSRIWDVQQWLGLGLLLSTLFVSLLLMFLGMQRQWKKQNDQLWGVPPLTTEQGVGELLNVGWKLQGNMMHVYDKRKIGYRDDDSMLIGGFEQRAFATGPSSDHRHSATETSTGKRPSDETELNTETT